MVFDFPIFFSYFIKELLDHVAFFECHSLCTFLKRRNNALFSNFFFFYLYFPTLFCFSSLKSNFLVFAPFPVSKSCNQRNYNNPQESLGCFGESFLQMLTSLRIADDIRSLMQFAYGRFARYRKRENKICTLITVCEQGNWKPKKSDINIIVEMLVNSLNSPF